MQTFPADIRFKFPWRTYQRRALEELEEHLSDGHLHLIAPPGSGKTILGLEVMLRLNQPTLIIAPTLAVRDQWVQRFCQFFLQQDEIPEWISTKIRQPEMLTVVTYQGLHAACTALPDVAEDTTEPEEETETEDLDESTDPTSCNEVIAALQAKGIKTLVADEAHHLKNSWWATLTEVKKALKPIMVGLTATPPYDVTYTEWNRYLEINGPIDAEISVPELVQEGDLCPHQDHVILSHPTESEIEQIFNFRERSLKLYKELCADAALTKFFLQHPVWAQPKEHLDWIYDNVRLYASIIAFLKHNKVEIPKVNLEVLGVESHEFPDMDMERLEMLLSAVLYDKFFAIPEFEVYRDKVENRLSHAGVLERKQINFRQNGNIIRSLTSSINKLESIESIVAHEINGLGNNLRMVILSDYIRKEFLPNTSSNTLKLTKTGVVPIFEHLRRTMPTQVKLGVLSGSLVVIPTQSLPLLKELCDTKLLASLLAKPLPFDEQYVTVSSSNSSNSSLVAAVTNLFQQGGVEVLIGTKSLLGEGWDAPAINSLILASFVGSFVSSNQMRGRALRKHRENPDKTANIWHLVCIDPSDEKGGADLTLMERRFRSFVGIAHDGSSIQNNLYRLNLPDDVLSVKQLEKANEQTFKLADSRQHLKKLWDEAIAGGTSLVEEITRPFPKDRNYQREKSLAMNRTIAFLIAQLVMAASFFLQEIILNLPRISEHISNVEDLLVITSVIIGFFFLYFGSEVYETFKLYVQYRDISKDTENIAKALLHTLCHFKMIDPEGKVLTTEAMVDKFGVIYCYLHGGSAYDQSIFITALEEILSPIDNPRYIMERNSKLAGIIKQQDFHAVPTILGRKKEHASHFANQWRLFVGKNNLIYTRTIEGRQYLLKARLQSLSAWFDVPVPERTNVWQ